MTSSNLCMVGWDDFRKKKKKDWKIGGNMGVRGAWLGEEGKEENGGV